MEPDVMLFDETNRSLLIRKWLKMSWRVIKDLADNGMTIVIVTHGNGRKSVTCVYSMDDPGLLPNKGT